MHHLWLFHLFCSGLRMFLMFTWCSFRIITVEHFYISAETNKFLDLGKMIMFYVIVMSLYDYMPIFCWCLWCIVGTYIYHTRIVWDSDSPPIYLRNGAPSSPRIRTWMPGATTRRSAGHSLRRVVMGPGCGVSCYCLFCEKCLLSGSWKKHVWCSLLQSFSRCLAGFFSGLYYITGCAFSSFNIAGFLRHPIPGIQTIVKVWVDLHTMNVKWNLQHQGWKSPYWIGTGP